MDQAHQQQHLEHVIRESMRSSVRKSQAFADRMRAARDPGVKDSINENGSLLGHSHSHGGGHDIIHEEAMHHQKEDQ
jgi:hypothetical protein